MKNLYKHVWADFGSCWYYTCCNGRHYPSTGITVYMGVWGFETPLRLNLRQSKPWILSALELSSNLQPMVRAAVRWQKRLPLRQLPQQLQLPRVRSGFPHLLLWLQPLVWRQSRGRCWKSFSPLTCLLRLVHRRWFVKTESLNLRTRSSRDGLCQQHGHRTSGSCASPHAFSRWKTYSKWVSACQRMQKSWGMVPLAPSAVRVSRTWRWLWKCFPCRAAFAPTELRFCPTYGGTSTDTSWRCMPAFWAVTHISSWQSWSLAGTSRRYSFRNHLTITLVNFSSTPGHGRPIQLLKGSRFRHGWGGQSTINLLQEVHGPLLGPWDHDNQSAGGGITRLRPCGRRVELRGDSVLPQQSQTLISNLSRIVPSRSQPLPNLLLCATSREPLGAAPS